MHRGAKFGFPAATRKTGYSGIDTMGVRAELLRIDAAMLAQASTARLRDPNDLPVLALLFGSGADHLVTVDKDLLALADTYPILTPAGFVDRFVP